MWLKLSFILLFSQCVYGQTLKGIVTLQNSGNKPLPNVKISAKYSNPTVSDSKGTFKLVFIDKYPGDIVELEVYRDGFEIVNKSELRTNIPNSNNYLVPIVMCKKGYRDSLAAEYYGISYRNIRRSYDKKIEQLRKQNKQTTNKYDSLYKAFQKEVDNLKSLSEKFAVVNLDNCSQIQKKALLYFKNGELEKAISILQTDTLELYWENAEKEKAAARELDSIALLKHYNADLKKNQVISSYLFKARLCRLKIDYNNAAKAYQMAFSKDSFNILNGNEFAYFLYEIGEYGKSIEIYKRIVSLTDCEDLHANWFGTIAEMHTKLLNYKDAEKFYNKAFACLDKLNKDSIDSYYYISATLKNNASEFYQASNKNEIAIRLLKESIYEIEMSKSFDLLEKQFRTGMAYGNIGAGLVRTGDTIGGLAFYKKAVAILEPIKKKSDDIAIVYFNNYSNIVGCYLQLGKYMVADSMLGSVYKFILDCYTKNKYLYEKTLHLYYLNKGSVCEWVNEFSEALNFSFLQLELIKKSPISSPNYIIEESILYFNIGLVYGKMKNFVKSEEYFEKCLRIRLALYKLDPEYYQTLLSNVLVEYSVMLIVAQNTVKNSKAYQMLNMAKGIYKNLSLQTPSVYNSKLDRIEDLLSHFHIKTN